MDELEKRETVVIKKVALLVGGWSAERQVSLDKGKEVEQALRDGGYDVKVVDVQKDLNDLMAQLTPKPDAVFNNLHGRGGEDGMIQSVLEILEIPYTHSNILASAVGMNKPMAKAVAAMAGVASPKGVLASKSDVLSGHVMPAPYVVKPPCEGSSVGIHLVLDDSNQAPLGEEDWTFGENVLVEEYVPGRELTVAVLDGEAQGVTEIISKTEFFDYEAKYRDERTDYVLPADIPKNIYDLALKNAQAVYNSIGCTGLARCDFRFDEQRGEQGLFFLEINTQPGLTAASIGPSQVIRNGRSFVELCSHLVETAQCHEKQQSHIASSSPSLSSAA